MQTLGRALALFASLLAITAGAKEQTNDVSHPGPVIGAYVQRGDARLPFYLVDHLRKGDKLLLSTDKNEKSENKWLLVLALVSPAGSKIDVQKFDLTEHNDDTSINVTADDQVPVIVLAPQVRTMFGLHTSFSESSSLITDAIKSDPQRFLELQKIDEINHVIASLKSALDSAVQSRTPEQAVLAAKSLAARFGVKNVDSSCFKDNIVDTKCVAASIVSSKDLALPSADDKWASSGPNASAAKIPTDIFASLKIVTEASTYLANKYGDNYDFAPSSGQRQAGSDHIQLFSANRFKSGEVKIAYVYVPSWFAGKPPEISLSSKHAACLSQGELTVDIKGALPLSNYWHDWRLIARDPASGAEMARLDAVDFNPDIGQFTFDLKKNSQSLPMNGQNLDVVLEGKYGFAKAKVNPFKAALPASEHLLNHVAGVENLVSGEKIKLRFEGSDHDADPCVEHMSILVNDKSIATSTDEARHELVVDLSKTAPGPAMLEVQQYGVEKQSLPVLIKKRRAHIERIVHFDLENTVTASGDNLERIDDIQSGSRTCKPVNDAAPATSMTTRVFSCPDDMSSNANFPAQVTIRHMDKEPAPFDFPVTKIGARPHMTVDGTKAGIVTILSPKAQQWNLNVDDPLITEDSGIGILLHAFGGYKLSKGSYVLQLKFADDPQTEQTPISVPLMPDLAHNELRTRNPVSFAKLQLPTVVNPVWYRIQHQQTGLVGDWQPLNRSVVNFPQPGAVSCEANDKGIVIHGTELELIDWASNDLTYTSTTEAPDADRSTMQTRCDSGLCLGINKLGANKKLRVKMHWIDDRLFDVTFASAPDCARKK